MAYIQSKCPLLAEEGQDDIIESNKIGLVKVRKDTPISMRISLENFFESKGLFISSISEGIIVSDTDRAAEEVRKAKELHKYETQKRQIQVRREGTF